MEGGCFCGSVRYEFTDGEYIIANCHCSMCRRISAAAFVTWAVIPNEAFRYTKGSPKQLKSSDAGIRHFCSDCGTPLACKLDKDPGSIDVTTGSMDEPNRFIPRVAVHKDSKLTWLHQTEVLEQG